MPQISKAETVATLGSSAAPLAEMQVAPVDVKEVKQVKTADTSADLKPFDRRSSTKKWMPTQHGGNGHVSGVESLNKYNLEKHGSWGGMRFWPHMLPFLPAIGAFKVAKTVSDLRAQKTVQDVGASEEPELVVHTNENKSSLKGMKAVRPDAKHINKSSCSMERELWQLCVKDRYNQKVDCKARLEAFRVCQDALRY
jgi:hypothetical protein